MTLHPVEQLVVTRAREDFLAMLEYAGVDDEGRPFQLRELDRFAWGWVESCWADGASAGLMLPTGSGKTTGVAWRIAWEIGRNPNLLVSLVCAAYEDACDRVVLVRQILDLPKYRRVFPEVEVGARDGVGGFVVKREGIGHNLTVSAHGVITGEGVRTNFLVLDDVINQKNAWQEPASRKRVTDSVRGTWMSRAKLGGSERPRQMWVQTAFHEDDAAATMRKDPKSGWRWLVVRAEPPFDGLAWEEWREGRTVDSGRLALHVPREEIEGQWDRMGPPRNARSLGNRTLSDADQPFREHHCAAPPPGPPESYVRRILYADHAGDATKAKRGDPDWCSCVAIGRRKDGVWEVYLAARLRGSPSRQAAFIATCCATAKPNRLYQECNTAGDEAFLEVARAALRKEGIALVPEPVKPSTNKVVRIRDTLEPHLEGGQLLVCGDRFPELREELLCFPAGAHDDLVDALEGAYAKVKSAGPMRHRSTHAPREEGKPAEEARPRRRRKEELRRGRIWDRHGRW